MGKDYSMTMFVIELEFVTRLNRCKWWQFRRKREAVKWREEQIEKMVT
jgi:hypothetical protein